MFQKNAECSHQIQSISIWVLKALAARLNSTNQFTVDTGPVLARSPGTGQQEDTNPDIEQLPGTGQKY